MNEEDVEPHLRDADIKDNRVSPWRWSLLNKIADWLDNDTKEK